MSSMIYVTFLIVTAIAICGVVEAAPRPKDTVVNEVAKNIDFINADNRTLGKPEISSVKGNAGGKFSGTSTVVCPPGYEAVEIYCYKINLQPGEHRQHRDLCFQSGGYLVAIETEEESNALIKYLRSFNFDTSLFYSTHLHIGLVDLHFNTEQSQFIGWMYTASLPYENWTPDQPGPRECGRLFLYEHSFGKWGVYICQVLYGGICEANPLAKLTLANY